MQPIVIQLLMRFYKNKCKVLYNRCLWNISSLTVKDIAKACVCVLCAYFPEICKPAQKGKETPAMDVDLTLFTGKSVGICVANCRGA